jgi:hypothetical protein
MLRMEGNEIAPAAPLRESSVIAPHEAVPSHNLDRMSTQICLSCKAFSFTSSWQLIHTLLKSLQFHPALPMTLDCNMLINF